jgi:hypothetical protein
VNFVVDVKLHSTLVGCCTDGSLERGSFWFGQCGVNGYAFKALLAVGNITIKANELCRFQFRDVAIAVVLVNIFLILQFGRR